MAKRSIMGVITGKLGNMVGQSNSLVNGADKQVWRVYNGEVKNPKTVAQARQRSLFVAVKNFQQAFSEILNHSWQGVDYGTKSLNHFRKLVLANGGADYPGFFYQPKGSQKFIPQPWPISRGSINVNTELEIMRDSLVYTRLNFVTVTLEELDVITVGEAWARFLAVNPQLQDGDMITILAMIVKNSDMYNPNGVAVPMVDRFVIDAQSTTLLADTGLFSQNGIFHFDFVRLNSTVPVYIQGPEATFPWAMGLIVSRQNGTKASWLRSKSKMYLSDIDPVVSDLFGSTAATTAALDSFMDSALAASSDWYLNETGANTGDGTPVTPVTVTVTSREATLNDGSTANLAYLDGSEGSGFLTYNDNQHYAKLNGQTIKFEVADTGKYLPASAEVVRLTDTLKSVLQNAGYTVDISDVA